MIKMVHNFAMKNTENHENYKLNDHYYFPMYFYPSFSSHNFALHPKYCCQNFGKIFLTATGACKFNVNSRILKFYARFESYISLDFNVYTLRNMSSISYQGIKSNLYLKNR